MKNTLSLYYNRQAWKEGRLASFSFYPPLLYINIFQIQYERAFAAFPQCQIVKKKEY